MVLHFLGKYTSGAALHVVPRRALPLLSNLTSANLEDAIGAASCPQRSSYGTLHLIWILRRGANISTVDGKLASCGVAQLEA